MEIKRVNILCKKLDHQFRNIVLLYEALTHNIDEETEWVIPYGNIVCKKKKYNRLKLLGVSVLKLLFAEQAVDDLGRGIVFGTVEGKLTSSVKEYQSDELMLEIGRELELKNYMEIGKGFNGNLETLYRPVLYAIFGAVFIDSGGCGSASSKTANGLKNVRKLFIHLWEISHVHFFTKSHTLQTIIRSSHKASEDCECDNVRRFLEIRIPETCESTTELQDNIKYCFDSDCFIEQSLTHDSVKQYQRLMDAPTFETLEFLGDAVYELVICEYLYWYFVNDDSQVYFNKQRLDEYTCAKFQAVISESLDLDQYILKASRVQIFDLQDFLESLIGAIYVDSLCSLAVVKEVVITLCEKFQVCHEKHGIRPLPYSSRTYCGSFAGFNTRIKHYEPPVQQNPVKITNIKDFLSSGCNMNSMYCHWDFLTHAKIEEEKDRGRTVNCSEEKCNQMEFERLSLYRTAACILSVENYHPETGTVINHHWYEINGRGILAPPNAKSTWIPECRLQNSPTPTCLNAENGVVSKEEVMMALNIIFRWFLMWAMLILKGLRNGLAEVLSVVLILLKVLIQIVLSTVAMAVLIGYFGHLILNYYENQKRSIDVVPMDMWKVPNGEILEHPT